MAAQKLDNGARRMRDMSTQNLTAGQPRRDQTGWETHVMLEYLEQQKKLTINQWKIFAAATIGDMLDFFDYLLIGFVLAFFVKDWSLTYGQSAAILLSAGISAPFGSIIWGWVADKIGRRKVMIATILNFSVATGLMALTPEHGWVYLVICRFFVGFGVTGLYTVDIAVVQEFVPASKRGWITGVTTTMLPAGLLLGAVAGQYLEAYVGWRGLFAIGLLPAGLSLLIRAWVPESPHWLIRVGRFEEARQSLAWALMIDPNEIPLPATAPPVEKVAWRELFKYPRSVVAGSLIGLTQTGGVGFVLWQVTLFVMLLHITPAQASGLVIWLSLAQIAGRFFCSWISDAMGRRASIALTCAIAGVTMSLAGYWHDLFLGGVSVFYLMTMVQQFFGSGSYSIIGPYMAEIWPSRLRGSGMGLVYGVGNLGKFIGPAGLALIAGSSNFVSPQATVDALIPAMNYFAVWYVIGLLAALFIAFETKGRTIDEIDSALTARGPLATPVKAPAV
jgi:putative MFS transporter